MLYISAADDVASTDELLPLEADVVDDTCVSSRAKPSLLNRMYLTYYYFQLYSTCLGFIFSSGKDY